MQAANASENVTMLPQRGIECLSRKMINKGALVAICDIRINGWHLVLRDCKWFRKDSKQWIGLPSTKFVDRNGKAVYTNLVEFIDKNAAARFQAAALEAVEMYRESAEET
jgi:hypothetical protein